MTLKQLLLAIHVGGGLFWGGGGRAGMEGKNSLLSSSSNYTFQLYLSFSSRERHTKVICKIFGTLEVYGKERLFKCIQGFWRGGEVKRCLLDLGFKSYV